MQEIYPLLRQADIIVMATPIFFYGPTAQMKALIDRSQALWARKYAHRLTDPGRKWRRGFLLALGATKGKNLFEGVNLTAKYFFDAVGASFEGSIAYKQIEGSGDIKKHPTALSDTKEKARALVAPFLKERSSYLSARKMPAAARWQVPLPGFMLATKSKQKVQGVLLQMRSTRSWKRL